MTDADDRAEAWAKSHRPAETQALIAYRAGICRECLWCDDHHDDRIVCAKTAEVIYLTIGNSCPIKAW